MAAHFQQVLGPVPMSLALIGSAQAAAVIGPLVAQVQALLAGAFGLGPLKAELVAQFNASINVVVQFGDPLVALRGSIAAIGQILASLRAGLSLGIPPLSIQVSANLSLAAALQAKIGGINLLIDLSLGVRLAGLNLLAQLNAALNFGISGGLSIYGWHDTPMATLQGTLGSYSFAGDGFAPGDLVTGTLIIAKASPAAYSSFSFLVAMPPP